MFDGVGSSLNFAAARPRQQAPQGDDDDYAINMARQQAEALMTTVRVGSTTSSAKGTVAISGGESDFAILAAKNAALRLKSDTEVSKKLEQKDTAKGQERDAESVPTIGSKTVQKGKVQDLSKDEMFLKLQKGCE